MKEITLENYRCFHAKQVARLAPLTLLVGDNSTGKTSFLAMIRAMWDCIYGHTIPDFKESPFDLGSFEEIAYFQNGRHSKVSRFNARLQISDDLAASVKFNKQGSIPMPTTVSLTDGAVSILDSYDSMGKPVIRVVTQNGIWDLPLPSDSSGNQSSLLSLRQIVLALPELIFRDEVERPTLLKPVEQSPPLSKSDADAIAGFRLLGMEPKEDRPFASAPVRSKPQRTYDPSSLFFDPEGDNVPMLLADLAFNDDEGWKNFKEKLENFGSIAGIFNEIDVKRLGKSHGSPFQIQIRKYGKRRKGPKQNLIDVGYGVSQILPILTELLLPGISRIALLQQPEVHLHPSAQAALGSLFCEIAGQGRQLVVETHSDHLINRIRWFYHNLCGMSIFRRTKPTQFHVKFHRFIYALHSGSHS